MHALHAGQHGGDHRAGEFVHEPAEERVFLGRPADDRDRPDRPLAVPDVIDPHHGKLVPPGVVAEMVAERPLRLRRARMHRALDHEVGVGVDRRAGRGRRIIGMRWPARTPANVSSERPSGSGITADTAMAGEPPTKIATLQRLAAGQRRRMVHADAAVELVVEAHLAVGLVGVARELHAIHAEVRVLRAGPVGVLRCRRPAA